MAPIIFNEEDYLGQFNEFFSARESDKGRAWIKSSKFRNFWWNWTKEFSHLEIEISVSKIDFCQKWIFGLLIFLQFINFWIWILQKIAEKWQFGNGKMLHQRPNQNRKVSRLEFRNFRPRIFLVTPDFIPESGFFHGPIFRLKIVFFGKAFRRSFLPWTISYESYLAEEAPEAADGEGAEGEGAEAVEGEEGLPEGYPVDEEAAAEGMKVEVRISPLTTNSLTPNVSSLYFF